MDEIAARSSFEDALSTHAPGFGTFFLARLLRLDITYPGNTCLVRFPVADFLFNPQGTLHGGIIATVLDISMGHLLKHHYGMSGSTLEMKTQFLGSIRSHSAWFEARFRRRGKSSAFLEPHLSGPND